MVLYHYNRILLDWQNAFLFPCGYRLCEVYFVIVGYILHAEHERQMIEEGYAFPVIGNNDRQTQGGNKKN